MVFLLFFTLQNGMVKLFFRFFFLLSFFSVNAQIFVSDSTVVNNNGAIIFSETDISQNFSQKSEAIVFISNGATIVNTKQFANTQIIYNKVDKTSSQKSFAKNLANPQKEIEKIVSTKYKQEKHLVFAYKNNEKKNRFFYSSFPENSVVIPNFNNTKSFVDKVYTFSLSVSDFSEISINNSLLVINFNQFFLEGHHNRPPPSLS